MHEKIAISVEKISKNYGGKNILSECTFDLESGSKTALLGANGSGKTTLLNILSTLISPSSGDAWINGYSLKENSNILRAQIGVLAHIPMVYPNFSLIENLRFFGSLYNLTNLDERVNEVLHLLDLWSRRYEKTNILSRGMSQRLALARAIIHKPKILLLDEPETGLDSNGLEILKTAVLEDRNMTVIASTHDKKNAENWAENLMTIYKGQISPFTIRK
tara:strand:+ start:2184 stop:2840 length:657 start_codon:yes stop_codon:yes gene_type:complete